MASLQKRGQNREKGFAHRTFLAVEKLSKNFFWTKNFCPKMQNLEKNLKAN